MPSLFVLIQFTVERMYIYKDFVTDEELAGQKRKILRKLWMNAGQLGIYLICLNDGPDQFDIIHTAVLKQRRYNKKDIHLLGIAKGRDSAAMLCGKLYLDFREKYGKDNFKEELTADKKNLFRRF